MTSRIASPRLAWLVSLVSTWPLVGCAGAAPAGSTTTAPRDVRSDREDWSGAIRQLADQLVADLPESSTLRLAVLDFRGSENEAIGVGARARDALAEAMLASGRFGSLVERAQLGRALEELRLQRTASSDGRSEFAPETVIQVAALEGANLVVLGVAEPIADDCYFTAKLVHLQSGTVEAIAHVAVPLSNDFVAGGCTGRASDGEGRAPASGATTTTSAQSFLEDFRSVAEGDVPPGWTGVDVLGVRIAPRGEHYLTCLRNGPSRAQIPIPAMTSDFRLEIVFARDGWDYLSPPLELRLGGTSFGLHTYSSDIRAFVDDSVGDLVWNLPAGVPIRLVLEKQGAILRLFVDGRLQVVSRAASDTTTGATLLECGLTGLSGSAMACRTGHSSLTRLSSIRITPVPPRAP